MKKLNLRFGDDGEFWMSFNDFCRKFNTIDRTRLFNEQWLVLQQWTALHVSWLSGYSMTKFVVEIKKEGPVVVVLRQVSTGSCSVRATGIDADKCNLSSWTTAT